jgi:hypothetical protein
LATSNQVFGFRFFSRVNLFSIDPLNAYFAGSHEGDVDWSSNTSYAAWLYVDTVGLSNEEIRSSQASASELALP